MMRRALLACLVLAAALPAGAVGDDALKTTITEMPPDITASSTATFSFTANVPDVHFACALDSAEFSSCTSPVNYTGLADGRHTFFVFASKGQEQEQPPPSWTWTVDTTPPTVHARAAVAYRRMVLTWESSTDTTQVVVLRSTRRGRAPSQEVYSGGGRRYTDRRFSNGAYHRYSIIANDRAGNVSASIEVDVTPSALLLSPADRAHFIADRRPLPVFRWRSAPGARYYNLQLWRGGSKVLSAWPRSTGFALKASWTYQGRRYGFVPGRYTWFVWPSFRPLPHAAYGPLLGQASFRAY
jgi:hypothetical protein